jgi:hypothetical protein
LFANNNTPLPSPSTHAVAPILDRVKPTLNIIILFYFLKQNTTKMISISYLPSLYSGTFRQAAVLLSKNAAAAQKRALHLHASPRSQHAVFLRSSLGSTCSTHRQNARMGLVSQTRNLCALAPEEEKKENERVASLSKYQKEMELREMDAKIKTLNMLRGINTGELYTWRGKSKALARDYGIGFMMWYYTNWVVMAGACYFGIEYGGVDAMALIAKTDAYTGFDLANKVDPKLGTMAVAVALNECLEPLRLIFVVSTTKPVVNMVKGASS